jgi:hypothetical protein
VPTHQLVKVGAAATAAAVGLILAIGSAAAHGATVGSTGSVGDSKSHVSTNYPFVDQDPAPNKVTDEAQEDAIEAADRAAALAAEQAKEAAEKAAALAAQQTVCVDTDPNERADAKKADQAADVATGEGTPADKTADAAARQADQAEDLTEPKCHPVDTDKDKKETSEPKGSDSHSWQVTVSGTGYKKK